MKDIKDGSFKPLNFRTHRFNLFDKSIEIAGMAGPHNNEDPNQALAYLKQNHRDVLIGLHETNFAQKAQQIGLDYEHIPVPDFAQTPIDVEVYEKIYEVVKEATNKGKAVTIHCGAGDGRSGTALASLKLRELLEIDIINSFLLGQTREKALTTVSTPMNHEVPCSYAVKNAVEQTRNQRGELDGENGKHSVETANDIATLMQYEAYLRNKLTLKLIYDEKKLATYIEKAIEEEKTRLESSVRKENCARERLEFLEHVLKSDFKDKSNIYAKLKTYNSLVSIHESLEDLKHFVLNQENCSDEIKQEKIKRIDEFISMLENKQVSVSLRFRAVKMEVLSPEFKDLFMKDSDYVLIRWFKLCIQSLFDIYNPSLSKYSMFSHKIGDLESSFENLYEQKNVRS